MAHNVRCKCPRSLQTRVRSRTPHLQHAYRWGITPTPPAVAPVSPPTPPPRWEAPAARRHSDLRGLAPAITPTPPPVTVSEPVPATQRSAEHRGGMLSKVLLVTLVVIAGLAGPVAWRVLVGGSPLAPAWRTAGGGNRVALRAAALLGPQLPAVPAEQTVEHHKPVDLDGGVLFAPTTFKPGDGSYDLLIHFHGNQNLVRESVERANLNCLLAVINLGDRASAYQEAFRDPGSFEKLLEQIRQAATRLGLEQPRLRRLALSGWSAGAATIEGILESRSEQPAEEDPLDAIIALDGVHCPYINSDPTRMKLRAIRSFINAARAAAAGRIMLSITHSEMSPQGKASTMATANIILRAIGADQRRRNPTMKDPPFVEIKATNLPKSRQKQLATVSDTHVGMLRVQGFAGDTREDHLAHLLQMSSAVLPDLLERWSDSGEE